MEMICQFNAEMSFSLNAKKSISASRSIQITWLGKSNLTGNTFAKRIWYDVKTQIWTQLKSNEEGIGFLVCTLLTFTFWILDLEILQDILHIQ